MPLPNYDDPSGNRPLVAIGAASNSVSVWDISTAECRRVLQVADAATPAEPTFASPEHQPIAGALLPGAGGSPLDAVRELGARETDARRPEGHTMRCILSAHDGSYVVTAGTDRRVRYWDIASASSSKARGGNSDSYPVCGYSQTDLRTPPSVTVNIYDSEREGAGSVTVHTWSEGDGVAAAAAAGGGRQRHEASDVTSHSDGITAMAAMQQTNKEQQGVLITGARDGVVKVSLLCPAMPALCAVLLLMCWVVKVWA